MSCFFDNRDLQGHWFFPGDEKETPDRIWAMRQWRVNQQPLAAPGLRRAIKFQ
jgi:hypothetical protein